MGEEQDVAGRSPGTKATWRVSEAPLCCPRGRATSSLRLLPSLSALDHVTSSSFPRFTYDSQCGLNRSQRRTHRPQHRERDTPTFWGQPVLPNPTTEHLKLRPEGSSEAPPSPSATLPPSCLPSVGVKPGRRVKRDSRPPGAPQPRRLPAASLRLRGFKQALLFSRSPSSAADGSLSVSSTRPCPPRQVGRATPLLAFGAPPGRRPR